MNKARMQLHIVMIRGDHRRMDSLTTRTHPSELQVIAALSQISKLYKSLHTKLSSTFTSPILAVDFNVVNITVSL
jgi:hypothetical protein